MAISAVVLGVTSVSRCSLLAVAVPPCLTGMVGLYCCVAPLRMTVLWLRNCWRMFCLLILCLYFCAFSVFVIPPWHIGIPGMWTDEVVHLPSICNCNSLAWRCRCLFLGIPYAGGLFRTISTLEVAYIMLRCDQIVGSCSTATVCYAIYMLPPGL